MLNLSIIIPVYNEENTIEEILNQILRLDLKNYEIILVDDCSTDETPIKINNFLNKNSSVPIKILKHEKNIGKGGAIKTAKKISNGQIIIIQDADLEYNPQDYTKLIQPIKNKNFEVVYGSRVLGRNRYQSNNFTSLFRVFANHILTIISNIINNQNLTDAHTCYKVFSKKIWDSIILEENDFSFCPEITTKVGNKKIRIHEVPIEYNGRSYKDGKKINFSDGIKAIKTLLKYKFFK